MRIQLMAAAYAGRVNLVANSPGPSVPIAGTLLNGFFGEVTQEELISYVELRNVSDTGLLGNYIANDQATWLKFTVDGKVLFVSKSPIINSVSWNELDNSGVIDGSFELYAADHKFKLKLLTGLQENASSLTAGGEWDSTILNVLAAPYGTAEWWNYTVADLGFGTGAGVYSYCLEQSPGNITYAVGRGGSTGNVITQVIKTSGGSSWGWRPVLEWVPPNESVYEPATVDFESPYLGEMYGVTGSVNNAFAVPVDISYDIDNALSVGRLTGGTKDPFALPAGITYSSELLLPVSDIGYTFQ
ncbi:hypothetical protein D9M68_18740 [compost metagenome]